MPVQAPDLHLYLELIHFYFSQPDCNLITQDAYNCVKRVKNTHLLTDAYTQTQCIPTATSLPVSHLCMVFALKALLPADGFPAREQQLCHQPVVGNGVHIQSWIQPSTVGDGAGGKRKAPEEALIEFLAVQHSSASSLCEIMPCKLSLPAKNSVYRLTEAISNAPSKSPAPVEAAVTPQHAASYPLRCLNLVRGCAPQVSQISIFSTSFLHIHIQYVIDGRGGVKGIREGRDVRKKGA